MKCYLEPAKVIIFKVKNLKYNQTTYFNYHYQIFYNNKKVTNIESFTCAFAKNHILSERVQIMNRYFSNFWIVPINSDLNFLRSTNLYYQPNDPYSHSKHQYLCLYLLSVAWQLHYQHRPYEHLKYEHFIWKLFPSLESFSGIERASLIFLIYINSVQQNTTD